MAGAAGALGCARVAGDVVLLAALAGEDRSAGEALPRTGLAGVVRSAGVAGPPGLLRSAVAGGAGIMRGAGAEGGILRGAGALRRHRLSRLFAEALLRHGLGGLLAEGRLLLRLVGLALRGGCVPGAVVRVLVLRRVLGHRRPLSDQNPFQSGEHSTPCGNGAPAKACGTSSKTQRIADLSFESAGSGVEEGAILEERQPHGPRFEGDSHDRDARPPHR